MKALQRENDLTVSKAAVWTEGIAWSLTIAASLSALVVIFQPLSVNLFNLPLSGSANESLGIFALLLSGWLTWRERGQLKSLSVKPEAWGFLILVLGALMAIASHRLVMRFTLGVALALIAAGTVWWFYGRAWVKRLWFPLFILVSIVPLPLDLVGAIAFRMQTVVTRYAAFLSGLLGIHVERVGVSLHIPGNVIQVNEACSGWHSFSAAFWLFLLLLYWQRPLKWWQWLWVIPVLLPISIIANIFRVTTVVVSSVNGFDLLLRSPWHEMLGLGYFLLLVWLLFKYFVKWQVEGSSSVICSVGEKTAFPPPARARAWQLAGLLWLTAGVVLWTGWQMGRAASAFKPPEIPNQLGDRKLTWKNVEGLDNGYWFAQARYEAENRPPLQVFLHIPIENRHRPKRLLNLWLGQGYELVSSETTKVKLASREVPVQLVQFLKGNEVQFVAVTYLHPKRAVTSPVTARWYLIREQLLKGVSQTWLAIGVSGNEIQAVKEAFAILLEMMDAWLQSSR